MSSLLEQRYRRALRMLPADYRQTWEEDMVATFLQAAYATDPDDPEWVELGSPSQAEVASIAALGLRLRLGGVSAAPRRFAWGEAVRRAALIGLLVQTIGALVSVVYMVWITAQLPGVTIAPDAEPRAFTNQWHALWNLAGLLWLPAYLSLVSGHRRAAQTLTVLAFAAVSTSSIAGLVTSDGAFVLSQTYWLVFTALPPLALTAFHPGAPRVNTRPWLIALPIGVTLAFGTLLLTQPAFDRNLPAQVLADWPGLCCAALTAATIVHLSIARRRGRHALAWTLALALQIPPVLGLRVTTLLDHLNFTAPTPQDPTLAAIGIAQCLTLLAAGTLLAILAAHRIRHLPASCSGSATTTDSPLNR